MAVDQSYVDNIPIRIRSGMLNATDSSGVSMRDQLAKNSAFQFNSADDVLKYLQENAGKDASSRDLLFNYLLSEKSTSSAREWEAEQNSKRYQVMVDDLKKAGLNPYWLNSLGGASTYQGSSNKYTSAFETARSHLIRSNLVLG